MKNLIQNLIFIRLLGLTSDLPKNKVQSLSISPGKFKNKYVAPGSLYYISCLSSILLEKIKHFDSKSLGENLDNTLVN